MFRWKKVVPFTPDKKKSDKINPIDDIRSESLTELKNSGMLRLILEHWQKRKKKKPYLLPLNADRGFDETINRVNPIFIDCQVPENRDSSILELKENNTNLGDTSEGDYEDISNLVIRSSDGPKALPRASALHGNIFESKFKSVPETNTTDLDDNSEGKKETEVLQVLDNAISSSEFPQISDTTIPKTSILEVNEVESDSGTDADAFDENLKQNSENSSLEVNTKQKEVTYTHSSDDTKISNNKKQDSVSTNKMQFEKHKSKSDIVVPIPEADEVVNSPPASDDVTIKKTMKVRAKAIDELMKKFQSLSSEDEKTKTKAASTLLTFTDKESNSNKVQTFNFTKDQLPTIPQPDIIHELTKNEPSIEIENLKKEPLKSIASVKDSEMSTSKKQDGITRTSSNDDKNSITKSDEVKTEIKSNPIKLSISNRNSYLHDTSNHHSLKRNKPRDEGVQKANDTNESNSPGLSETDSLERKEEDAKYLKKFNSNNVNNTDRKKISNVYSNVPPISMMASEIGKNNLFKKYTEEASAKTNDIYSFTNQTDTPNSNETHKKHNHESEEVVTRSDEVSAKARQPKTEKIRNNSTDEIIQKKSRRSSLKNDHDHSIHYNKAHRSSSSSKHSSIEGDMPFRRHRGRPESWASEMFLNDYLEKEYLTQWRHNNKVTRCLHRQHSIRSSYRAYPIPRSKFSKDFYHRPYLDNYLGHAVFLNQQNLKRKRASIADINSLVYLDSLRDLNFPTCSCDECSSHLYQRNLSSRNSVRSTTPSWNDCTCRATPTVLSSTRKVKFADHQSTTNKKDNLSRMDELPETESESQTNDESKGSSRNHSQLQSEQSGPELPQKSPDGKNPDNSRLQRNKHQQSKNGVTKSNFAGEQKAILQPWELEQWDALLRYNLLMKRRSRALCMGVTALVMVIFVGLIVGMVMVYLRRKSL